MTHIPWCKPLGGSWHPWWSPNDLRSHHSSMIFQCLTAHPPKNSSILIGELSPFRCGKPTIHRLFIDHFQSFSQWETCHRCSTSTRLLPEAAGASTSRPAAARPPKPEPGGPGDVWNDGGQYNQSFWGYSNPPKIEQARCWKLSLVYFVNLGDFRLLSFWGSPKCHGWGPLGGFWGHHFGEPVLSHSILSYIFIILYLIPVI